MGLVCTIVVLSVTLCSYLKIVGCKMSDWYQINPKVYLHSTALLAQVPCLASLWIILFSLRKLCGQLSVPRCMT